MLIGTEKKPKGPNFKSFRCIEKELSGSKLRFLAPPPKDPFSNVKRWETEPNSQDIFSSKLYHDLEVVSIDNGKRHKIDKFRVLNIYSNCWEFRGLPVLEGYRGQINLLIDLYQVTDLPVNESLFDNNVLVRESFRHFNFTKLQNCHQGHSDDPLDFTNYRWPSFLGPINSQWVNRGGNDWFYFEDQPLVKDIETITWNTAISDKCYLSFRFLVIRSARNAGNPYRIEQRVSKDNFLVLMHQIMDSLTLELSAESAARQTQIQGQSGIGNKPQIDCSPEQVEEAKHILYMWSDREYEDSSKGEDDDHRASLEEVAAFVDERIKPRPLPNSYPPGDLLKLSPQPSTTEPQTAQ